MSRFVFTIKLLDLIGDDRGQSRKGLVLAFASSGLGSERDETSRIWCWCMLGSSACLIGICGGVLSRTVTGQVRAVDMRRHG